ncbi:16S rRNA (uracil(1498)-N(3))-methyltransferase [Microbaculum sp. FT89]|uniref:16S rRNA (uracil(1498)-N(3))-methyltransferase n=1 Tax=Microbaculum sp. FT89 TaxID=3447298 RepID=UPI003F52C8E2
MSKPQRLFVEAPLSQGARVALPNDQAHYLLNVMRRGDGDPVALFNGRDGEWLGAIRKTGKRSVEVEIAEKTREQSAPRDIHYCFAPIKRARLDFIAQKATELGVARLQPIVTRFTVAERVKTERLAANAVEAAEQCGILWVPEIAEPVSFERYLADRDPARTLVFCDEAAPVSDPIEALKTAPEGAFAVMIGPEGGFAEEERELLLRGENVVPISLGPRVMRADTAGIAALTLLQAVRGDWR